ncbi:hypothetical protein ATANTOWER_012462 [Ataeniobius toweri]|uniref:Uncharacterized protein n=1 Tax=Ataeniobius toweri TaxID=208326 RepID=A0ABU7CBP4_9TELE|nr:hypothetical protein [Ataeniobius toweri]
MFSYLSLVFENELSFEESESCTSGTNMIFSGIPVFSDGLLQSFVVTSVHCSFLLGAGGEERFLCSPGHAVSSRCRVLLVGHLPRSVGWDLSFGLAPKELQGGLLVGLLSFTSAFCYLAVLVSCLSYHCFTSLVESFHFHIYHLPSHSLEADDFSFPSLLFSGEVCLSHLVLISLCCHEKCSCS